MTDTTKGWTFTFVWERNVWQATAHIVTTAVEQFLAMMKVRGERPPWHIKVLVMELGTHSVVDVFAFDLREETKYHYEESERQEDNGSFVNAGR